MGGGRLHASLSARPLGAWFDAFVDFPISYWPFYFSATGGLAVGVRFSMDLWLVTVGISAEISATLTVMGPPMAGTVYVDFWVFGFDINFGDIDAARKRDKPLTLSEFMDLAVKASGVASRDGKGIALGWIDVGEDTEDGAAVEEKEKETAKPFLFNRDTGLVPDSGVPGTDSQTSFPEHTWIVRGAALSFTISLGFAATEAILLDQRRTALTREKHVEISDGQKKIFARPMQLRDPLISTVTVTITKQDTTKAHSQGNERTDEEWGIQPVLKAVPQSIWGGYSSSDDPGVSGNGVWTLLDGNQPGSMSAVIGLTLTPPLPFMSKDTLPNIHMQRDMLQSVNKKGFPFADDAASKADLAWNPRPLTDEEKASRAKRWDAVVEVWMADGSSPGKKPSPMTPLEGKGGDKLLTRSEKVVNAWAARPGFQKGAVTGRKPEALIARFGEMVPVAPAIAVGST